MSELKNKCNQLSTLNNSFESFKKSIIKVNYQKNLTKLTFEQLDLFEKELENHDIIVKTTASNKDRINGTINTNFKNLVTNQYVEISYDKYTYSDLLATRREIKNQQYQLLLLHAFEAFEKYLKDVNKTYSLCKKDGATYIANKIILSSDWFANVINKGSNKALSDADYLVLDIAISEQLRHNIAHAFGLANDKNYFIKECLDRIGYHQNGKPKIEFVDNINYYFGTQDYENLICLVEIYDENVTQFISSYYDRLAHLIETFCSFVFLIHNNLDKLPNQPTL